jgi:hypothetical protein
MLVANSGTGGKGGKWRVTLWGTYLEVFGVLTLAHRLTKDARTAGIMSPRSDMNPPGHTQQRHHNLPLLVQTRPRKIRDQAVGQRYNLCHGFSGGVAL